MYEDILRIIDLQLDKLKRARQVLTTTETAPTLAVAEAAPPPVAEPVAVVMLPPARRRAFARRSRQPTVQQAAALADALSGIIPSRPIFVSAATVKAQAARGERPVVAVKPAPTEGTLDSLIRDLTRLPSGDRSSSPF